MKLRLRRFADLPDCTLGALYVDETFTGFVLEDRKQPPGTKVPSETRIPAGVYEIELQSAGRLHEKYKGLYPDMHVGMLHLKNVPGFTGIMIHRGVTQLDTEGCLLVGDIAVAHGELENSAVAYTRIYPLVAQPLLAGESVFISVEDQ